MANELELLTINAALDSWVDLVPDAISTGYQAQNTNIEARSNGLESLYVEISGTDAIFNPSGVIDDNGAPMVVKTQVSLAVPSGQRFIRVIDGVDPTKRSLQLESAIGAYDESKNGYYTSGDRMLNWSLNDISGSLKSYKILAPLHAHILGDALFDGNITQTSGTTLLTGLDVAPNTDISVSMGKGKMGYPSAGIDSFYIGHYDNFDGLSYNLRLLPSGSVYLNAKLGETVSVRNNNALIAEFLEDAIELKKPTTITGLLDVSSYGLFGGAIYDTINTLNVDGSGIFSGALTLGSSMLINETTPSISLQTTQSGLRKWRVAGAYEDTASCSLVTAGTVQVWRAYETEFQILKPTRITGFLEVSGSINPTTLPTESIITLTSGSPTQIVPNGLYHIDIFANGGSMSVTLQKKINGVWRNIASVTGGNISSALVSSDGTDLRLTAGGVIASAAQRLRKT